MKSVLVLTNSINGLYSFRRELIQQLLDQGYKVDIAAPKDKKSYYFNQIGCRLIEISMNRRGINPFDDLKLLLKYIKIVKVIKREVGIVITYTIKPNVYGGLICRLLRVPYIANVTGLGTSIENQGLIGKTSLLLYKIGLRKAKCIFFQNESNRIFFSNNNIIMSKTRLVPGSGVNTFRYKFEEYPDNDGIIKFLFLGRIMKAKGIDELLAAAKKIKQEYPNVQFDLVGNSEEDYSYILKELEKDKVIKYHGYQSDIHSYIKHCHAIINPSYHEGMSNVLLEAASTGRPILATNIPGCRETFDEAISGFGFEAKKVDSLVETIKKFIELPYEGKKEMGMAGRKKMEKEFDRDIVVNAYMEEIENNN